MSLEYKYKILVIDKDESIRKELIKHLNNKLYGVSEAKNSEQGDLLLKDERIDFIIQDITSGSPESISKILKDKRPVIVSADEDNIHKAILAMNDGACSLFLKPLDNPAPLFTAVQKCLKHSRKYRQQLLYTKHLEDEIKNKNDEIDRKNEMLSRFNNSLEQILSSASSQSSMKDLSDYGSDILDNFGAQLQASGGSIYMREAYGLRLVHTIESKHTPDFLPFPLNEKSPFKKVLKSGKPILIDNIDSEKDIAGSGWSGYEDSSFMIFPLPDHNGNVTGLLSLHNKLTPPFIKEDKDMGMLMSAFYKEVTRAVSSVESLHLSESRYKHLTENSAAVIFSFSIENEVFDFINNSFLTLTGHDRDEVINRDMETMINVLDIQQKEDIISHFENMITGRSSGSGIEYQIKTASGQIKWVYQQTVTIMNSEGFPVSIDGTMTEFSDQKEAEEELKTLVQQKDLLLSEINHRVKNNLQIISSLINLQSGLEQDDAGRNALNTVKSRITSIALVHDNIYDTDLMPTIDVQNYIEKLISNLIETILDNNNITITKDVENIDMDLDRAVLCGLIINEAISNAFRHAFESYQSGSVSLLFKTSRENYLVKISDTGRGFNPDLTDKPVQHGLGIDIMNSLIKQLNGSIDFYSDKGTEITIKFPIENSRIREELL